MALCLADSLLASGELDQSDLMQRFIRWWKDGENSSNGRCFDIGITTRTALSRFLRTGDPKAGSTDPQSAGNGSVMRLAPVALRWHREPSRAAAAAREQSVPTHAAPAAVEGCALLAEVLIDAVATGDKAYTLRSRRVSDPSVDAVARGSWRDKDRQSIRSSGYVVHTLEAALWAVDRSDSFESAVLLAANLGEDADTVGAVTGQIAGALYGLSGIPPTWRTRLACGDRIEALGRRLVLASTK
jgi:ADP-ribosyl-[dinitrogen reductase] hydrolase